MQQTFEQSRQPDLNGGCDKRLRSISGVRIAEPKGAFYAYPNISVAFRKGISSAMQFSERLLADAHVAVVPGEAFGTDQHFRLSYATSIENLAEGSKRLKRFFSEHGN